MFQEDFIVRQIALFIQILTAILGLAKKGQHRLALSAINEAYHQHFGLSATLVERLTESGLIEMLTLGEDDAAGRNRVVFVAALLRETGAIRMKQGREAEGYQAYLKALNLRLEVALGPLGRVEGPLPEFAAPIEALADALDDYSLPTSTTAAIFQYHKSVGDFARAETYLLDLLEADPGNQSLIEGGLAFYQGLLGEPDASLQAGGMSRSEVQKGLANVEKTAAARDEGHSEEATP